ncbi:MAG: hypothetical protein LBP52_05750 [Burkholderiaceae bacterium]|jgi:hypothetical protein|nr:hypothetical protein [Burkholderiaceae bacterium]
MVFYDDSTMPPDWTILGSGILASGVGSWTPHLTAGIVPGDGWLRLTENVNLQAGTAVYNTPFSSTEGLEITFDYAAYGKWTSEDADGLSFFLNDGTWGC